MIIFAADLHLTKRVWRARRDLDGDSFRALAAFQAQILELHGTEPVSVILGGDVFDKNSVGGAPLQAFSDFVDALFDEDINVYIIQGNHDLDPDISIAEVQGSIPLDKTVVEIDGRKVYGLDWRTREDLQEELKQIPKNVEMLVLHGMAEHLMDFEAAADFSIEDIPAHVQHVVVGDIHVDEVAVIGGTTCVSPGPLHPTKIDQSGPYGFYVLPKGTNTWVRQNVPGREILRFAMMSESDIPGIEEALPIIQSRGRTGYEPLVELKYISEFSDIVDRWVEKFTGIRFFQKPSAKGKVLSKEELLEAQESFHELSLVNSLPMVVDEGKDKELYGFLHSCLQGNAQTVVEAKVEAFLCNQSG